MRPEGLGNLIKIIHLIGSRTRDLPVFVIFCHYINNTFIILIIFNGTLQVPSNPSFGHVGPTSIWGVSKN
jgi:hypothetical protein